MMIVIQVVARVDVVLGFMSRWLPGWMRFDACCPGGCQGGLGFGIYVQVVARVDEV